MRRWLPLLILVIGVLPLVWKYILTPEPGRWMVDLQVYRDAGSSILRGRAVYDWRTPPPQNLPFTYPPIAALLSVPLALVPFKVAGVVWFLAQVAANAAIVRMAAAPLIRRAGERGPLLWAVLTVAALHLLPVSDGFRFGQVNAFLILMCLLDLVRPARVRWLQHLPQGVLVGLATAIKLTPGVFLIHLVLTRQWRAAATAVLTAAIATVGMFVLMPRSAVQFWFSALLDPERVGRNDGTPNQSLRGVILRIGPEGTIGTALWALLVVAVLVIGFGAARRAHDQGRAMLAVSLVGAISVLVSPVSWTHHLHWLLPGLLVLLGSAPERHRARTAAVAALWVTLTLPLTWWANYKLVDQGTYERYLSTGNPFWTLLNNSYALAAVITAAMLVWQVRAPERAARPSAAPDPVRQPAGSPAER